MRISQNRVCTCRLGIASEGNDLTSMVEHDCEAVISGELESVVFDFIADSCITRYNGAGYPADIALDLMEKRELKLIRNPKGSDECDGSHHNH